MTSQRVKNKKYDTRRSWVAWLLFFTCRDVFCDLLQYTCHTGKCTVIEGLSNGLLKGFWGMKKENMDLIPSVRVSFNNQWKCTQKSCYCIKIYTATLTHNNVHQFNVFRLLVDPQKTHWILCYPSHPCWFYKVPTRQCLSTAWQLHFSRHCWTTYSIHQDFQLHCQCVYADKIRIFI